MAGGALDGYVSGQQEESRWRGLAFHDEEKGGNKVVGEKASRPSTQAESEAMRLRTRFTG